MVLGIGRDEEDGRVILADDAVGGRECWDQGLVRRREENEVLEDGVVELGGSGKVAKERRRLS